MSTFAERTKQVHECDRRQTTDDRQTDHATEKCIAKGGIACAARPIPPNLTMNWKWPFKLVPNPVIFITLERDSSTIRIANLGVNTAR